MTDDLSDLIPLFVSEAKDRLERMAAQAASVESSDEAAIQVKRELHALKGAGRMLGMAPIATLCHRAEDVLNPVRPGAAALITRVVDCLQDVVTTVGAGGEPEVDPELEEALERAAAGEPEGEPRAASAAASEPEPEQQAAAAAAATKPVASSSASDVRVAAAILDELADRSTHARLIALGAGQTIERLRDLARLAEDGVVAEQPRQVLAAIASSLRKQALALDRGQRSLLRTADRQLDLVLGVQIQPMRAFLNGLARHARTLARSLGKEVRVVVEGEATRLDRRIVAALETSLLHLVRNAVDHGLEAPDEREHAGKKRAGTVTIRASSEGDRVRLEVADDGHGIDADAVVERAIAAGIVAPERRDSLGRAEVFQLLFATGFSTREEVSEISGRGVGLDAVAAAIRGVGGEVWISASTPRGTTVSVLLPIARRGERVVVVRSGHSQAAVPAVFVDRYVHLDEDRVSRREEHAVARLEDSRLVPLVSLAAVMGGSNVDESVMLIGHAGGAEVALAVDAIVAVEEVLVRPLTKVTRVNPVFDGMTLLSTGTPVPVVSPVRLLARTSRAPVEPRAVGAPKRRVTVLLVDDSLVTREMERRLLEDAGYDVVASPSAAEALEQLGRRSFDVVVTDVEMPGMDGLELTRRLRRSPHLANIPVVVVSTRDKPDDRLAGLDAGADAYLAKQGLDADAFVDLVGRLGGRP